MILRSTTKQMKEVVTEIVKTQCDLCGVIVDGSYRPNWAEKGEYYQISRTTIEMEDGADYPGGDSTGEKYETHVCVSCFQSKVRPALEAIGCKFHMTDR